MPKQGGSSLPPLLIACLVFMVIAGAVLAWGKLCCTPSEPAATAHPPAAPTPISPQAPAGSTAGSGSSSAQPTPGTSVQGAASPPPSGAYPGKIVFTCQIFKDENRNQVCIMNGDGTGFRRITRNDRINAWYASLAPDGGSIVYSSNESGAHEIHEMDLDGSDTRLTSLGESYAPEISPDGRYIAFTNANGLYSSIWIMNRDGSDAHELFSDTDDDAVGPSWSPDGRRILFAVGAGDRRRLHVMNADGSGIRSIKDSFLTGGRSDWSPIADQLVSYSGDPGEHVVFVMDLDGGHLSELYSRGNVQAPAFSQDGLWIAFTGYIDRVGDAMGCEIYALRLADKALRRLTNNDYCDWQPRWGP